MSLAPPKDFHVNKRHKKKRENRKSVGDELETVEGDHVAETDRDENKRRRTLLMQKSGNSWGFTLQTYVIHHKSSNQNEVLTYVDYVDLEGPAFLAGLRRGDVILAINGKSTGGWNHKQLVKFVKRCGNTLRMVVLFEDCCRKIDAHSRYMKLRKVLNEKIKEYRELEMKEQSILMGSPEDVNLRDFKSDVSSLTSLDTLDMSFLALDDPARASFRSDISFASSYNPSMRYSASSFNSDFRYSGYFDASPTSSSRLSPDSISPHSGSANSLFSPTSPPLSASFHEGDVIHEGKTWKKGHHRQSSRSLDSQIVGACSLDQLSPPIQHPDFSPTLRRAASSEQQLDSKRGRPSSFPIVSYSPYNTQNIKFQGQGVGATKKKKMAPKAPSLSALSDIPAISRIKRLESHAKVMSVPDLSEPHNKHIKSVKSDEDFKNDASSMTDSIAGSSTFENMKELSDSMSNLAEFGIESETECPTENIQEITADVHIPPKIIVTKDSDSLIEAQVNSKTENIQVNTLKVAEATISESTTDEQTRSISPILFNTPAVKIESFHKGHEVYKTSLTNIAVDIDIDESKSGEIIESDDDEDVFEDYYYNTDSDDELSESDGKISDVNMNNETECKNISAGPCLAESQSTESPDSKMIENNGNNDITTQEESEKVPVMTTADATPIHLDQIELTIDPNSVDSDTDVQLSAVQLQKDDVQSVNEQNAVENHSGHIVQKHKEYTSPSIENTEQNSSSDIDRNEDPPIDIDSVQLVIKDDKLQSDSKEVNNSGKLPSVLGPRVSNTSSGYGSISNGEMVSPPCSPIPLEDSMISEMDIRSLSSSSPVEAKTDIKFKNSKLEKIHEGFENDNVIIEPTDVNVEHTSAQNGTPVTQMNENNFVRDKLSPKPSMENSVAGLFSRFTGKIPFSNNDNDLDFGIAESVIGNSSFFIPLPLSESSHPHRPECWLGAETDDASQPSVLTYIDKMQAQNIQHYVNETDEVTYL
ncbi:unnamed protein product [Owenia fusiformis]|uniref:Uncharacterized protein n=1 Tax=Owenia fusiformis TaxID=6347 RepID=A0A8J1XT09_OWEFU|nr:unnamed protein product [Owenia fusiformis]